jgi:hypothetical protein
VSAVNNDVARTAGLIAVAVLPAAAGLTGSAYLHPAVFNAGYHEALLIAAGVCAGGGVLAAFTISNRPQTVTPCAGCGLDAPLLASTAAGASR